MFVDISATKGLGIDDLLEAIILTADAALDLRANPTRTRRAWRSRPSWTGPRPGGHRAGAARHAASATRSWRARPTAASGRMLDEDGKQLAEAPPSRPVQVLGLTAVPKAGDNFLVVSDDRMARQIAERREARERTAQFAQRRRRVTLEDLDSALKAGEREELLLIIKGDVSGSVEALEDALLKLDVGEEVHLRVIGRGVGAITQDDVNLAIASEAVIIGFNVRPAGRQASSRSARAWTSGTTRSSTRRSRRSRPRSRACSSPSSRRSSSARPRSARSSGCRGSATSRAASSAPARSPATARRGSSGTAWSISDNLTVESLRRFKDDATEVREGFECGIGVGYNDIRIEDVIETFEMREKPRGLGPAGRASPSAHDVRSRA